MVFRWGFVLRLVFGVDCGKHFVSSGRMCVEVLGPTVNLMSDKIAYCTSITNSVVGGLVGYDGGVQTTLFLDVK